MSAAPETLAARELRCAWRMARRDRRLHGIPYNENKRLDAATQGAARECAARFSYLAAEIEALCAATDRS